MPDFEISPKSVAITAGQTQEFVVLQEGQRVPSVQWSILPTKGAGEIGPDSGVYTAPRRIFRDRKAVIVANPQGGSPTTATVELISLSFWTHFLGYYLLASFVLLLGFLIWKWELFCPTCKPGEVRLSPPVVTLMSSQSQAFSANVPVQWSANVRNKFPIAALYTAPATIKAGGEKTQVTATMKEEPQKTGTAEVFLSPIGGLFLQPATATILAGGSVDLTAVPHPPSAPGTVDAQAPPPSQGTQPQTPEIEWMKPEIGALTPIDAEGRTARFSVEATAFDRPATLLILAQVRENPPRIAGAWITVLPASARPATGVEGCGSDAAALLRLIAIFGALGGIIHGISSFTTYVGNREFVSSWVWWYVFKPFLGALVGLVVFLIFRAGFGVGDFSLAGADCLRVAAFAGLIGLFAEPATLKLKDIFDTLFTPRRDPRQDAAGEVKGTGPTLVSITPTTLTVGQAQLPSLIIDGSGFSKDCQVKIGNASLRKPTKVSTTQVEVPLLPADVEKPGKLDVIVYNKPPDEEPSKALQIEVKEPAQA